LWSALRLKQIDAGRHTRTMRVPDRITENKIAFCRTVTKLFDGCMKHRVKRFE
jgi:hypothetical protein